MFGSSLNALDLEFEKEMKNEFEMSMVDELTFFLSLQVKQMDKEIFIYLNPNMQRIW